MKASRRPVLSAIDEHINDGHEDDDDNTPDLSNTHAGVSAHTELRCMLTLPPEVYSASGLDDVKAATTRLHLIAKRPSIVAWKNKYMGTSCPVLAADTGKDGGGDGGTGERLTQPRKQRINEALAWLRNELVCT
jgi:hypothetical protein